MGGGIVAVMRQPFLLLLACATAECAAGDYFQIRIVDEQTGRGVPLVEFRTTNEISCWTDSNGIVAWNEPGLMDREVYFTIQSPGYTFPGGGKTLKAARGGRVELKIKRLNVAERLYRVTGQGIYRDSLLTGYPVPIRAPALNGMVMGQDTVRAAIYRGKLFWLWGDTNRPNGPLGNFKTTAATSELSGRGGLDPAMGIDLSYFTGPEGFVKQMIPWTKRMTWMHSLMVLSDPAGRERLVSYYEVIRALGDPEWAGLAVFNDEKSEFDPLVEFPDVPKFSIDGNASDCVPAAQCGFPPSGGRCRTWALTRSSRPKARTGCGSAARCQESRPRPHTLRTCKPAKTSRCTAMPSRGTSSASAGSPRSSATPLRFGTPKPTPPQAPSYMPRVWRYMASTPFTGQCRTPSSTRTADAWSISKASTPTPFPATL